MSVLSIFWTKNVIPERREDRVFLLLNKRFAEYVYNKCCIQYFYIEYDTWKTKIQGICFSKYCFVVFVYNLCFIECFYNECDTWKTKIQGVGKRLKMFNRMCDLTCTT